MKGLTDYLRNSVEELNKVTWPTKNQAVRLTIIVFVFCLLMALILGFLDFSFNELYIYLLRLNF